MAVMLFASLAPSASHALALWTGNQAFTQKICTSSGTKVVIQGKTTMGKQIATALNLAPASTPQVTESHLTHCPYCANPSSAAVLPQTHHLIVAVLTSQAQAIAVSNVVAIASQPYLSPPSQAPPDLSTD